jgi:hypothetical protein
VKAIYLLLICTTFAFSQTTYKYGQDGIELFVKGKETLYVYQQTQAKMNIRGEVASEILRTYLKKKNLGGKKTICTSQGEVTGILKITRKHNFVLLNFQYTSILWNDGTLEKTIVKKKPPKKKSKKKK